MAKLPSSVDSIIGQFGPHKGYTPKEGFHGVHEPDKLVKTHCCFCGMQCGIQLKVKDNKVTGFEPWMEFPFNEGRLCPKGVQRYLQNNHPDRLLAPYKRVEGKGFEQTSWEEAMSKTVSEIQRIQNSYGRDAFAMLSGVSLTNEKSYMVGKFARVALKTANLDYNGRLCMVSAGAGNKKAFGLDRISNSWEDLKHAEVIIIAGTNVSETFPTLTHYIWQARDNGAKLIVIDPRVTPIARTADLHLPVRPGGDSALFGAMLKILVDNDWLDHDFIDNYTSGFQESIEAVKDYNLDWAEEKTGIPAAKIQQAAEWWGKAKTSFLLHARGIEHHSKGVDNVLSCINLVLATGRIGKPYCGYGTITGQGNGQGGREHGHKCDQLPGNRDITNPEHRKYIADVWGIDEKDLYFKPGDDSYGLEQEPHMTLVFGIHEDEIDPNIVRDVMEQNLHPIKVMIKEISIFEQEEFDVVKYEIPVTPEIQRYRKLFLKFPNTQEFPDYKPHMTIAYVKSGTGKKYAKKLEQPLIVIFNKAVYSLHENGELVQKQYVFPKEEIEGLQ